MLSIVVTGRNDDYAGGFRDRLFRTCRHNVASLAAAGIDHEFVLVEWNPVPGRPLLASLFTDAFPNARAVVVSSEVHDWHSANPHMPFDEMAAKNVGLRRAKGEWAIAVNADILLGREVVGRLRGSGLRADTLYRAHRIDVPADVPDEDVEETDRSLASGEGSRPPAYYLGAGGDFCLAATPLWHRLGGFNQRVRFSTRAKDWQFFLSAAALGVDVKFLGKVFHLDHEGGFRNTPPEERGSVRAHFGGLWDIEFGLPLAANPDWGFPALASRRLTERVEELRLSSATVPHVGSDALAQYLAWPPGEPDNFSAALAHAVFAVAVAGRSLEVHPSTPKEAAAAVGMAAVARAFGVETHVEWDWTALSERNLFGASAPSRRSGRGDVRLSRHGDGWALSVPGRSRPCNPQPRRLRCEGPAHNPMLGRRLLRAWLRLRELGARRVAIYGAGGHTEELLRWGVPDCFSVDAVLVTNGGMGDIGGIPVRSVHAVSPSDFDAVLLSSIPYEAEMADNARSAGFGVVVPLWSDWPREFWAEARAV